jgi:hypothetical protein
MVRYAVVQRPTRPTPDSSAETGRLPNLSKQFSCAFSARSIDLAAYIVHLRYAEFAQAVAHASRSFFRHALRLLSILRS